MRDSVASACAGGPGAGAPEEAIGRMRGQAWAGRGTGDPRQGAEATRQGAEATRQGGADAPPAEMPEAGRALSASSGLSPIGLCSEANDSAL